MNNFLFEIILSFLFGIIFFLIVEYLIYKFSERKIDIIFTNDISSESITFVKDYQEILTGQLGENTPYHVIRETTFCKALLFN
jgi:hypothetical protein